MISDNDNILKSVETDQVSESVNQYCDNVLANMQNIDIITICNSQGTRLYHRDKEKIGEHIVGNDEGLMLSTHQNYFNTATGTLGIQRRYFHALFDDNNKFIGFICVSVLVKNLEIIKDHLLLAYWLIGCIGLILVFLTASQLNSSLKNVLFGYEPEQIARMIIQHQEVLDSLDEGLLAIDNLGVVSLLNKSAMQMLSIQDENPIGKFVLDVFPESHLPRILKSKRAEYNVNLTLKNIHLITSRIPVIENNEVIGVVSIFRNQNEVIKLSEQLTGINHIVEAMRAYTHEFNNKLHVIWGLIQCELYRDASNYIMQVATIQKNKISQLMSIIKEPNLCALLIGKICRASELNISLLVDENSYVDDIADFLPSTALNTIVGNLLDNSIENLNFSDAEEKSINLIIFYDSTKFFLNISDTGSGIQQNLINKIFDKGFSTKGSGRDTGLFIVKDLVEANNGNIQVESELNKGTIFTITIENKTNGRGV